MVVVREVVREEPDYHHHHNNSSWIWAIVLIVVVALLFTYGIPLLRARSIRPQVNIPDHVNVNITRPQAPQGGGPAPQSP